MDTPNLRAAVHFGACLLVGLVVMALPHYDVDPLVSCTAALLILGSAAATLLVIRRAGRGWWNALPVAFMLPGLALIFHATGGTFSPVISLVAIPVIWTALFGSRRDLFLCGTATGLTLLLPIVLVGGESYPWSAIARPVLWAAIAFSIGPAIQDVVRGWRLERARQESAAAELRAVLDGSRIACLITCNLDGSVRSFGVGAQRLLGYTEAEVLEHGGPDLWHDPKEVSQIAAELGVSPGFEVFSTLARSDSEPRTWRFIRKDGSRVFATMALTALRTSTGEVTGYLGVAIDSTEDVQRKREIAAANARWQILADNIPDTALFTLDSDLTVGLVAGTGAMAVGLRDAEGHHLAEFSTPANMAVIAGMVERACAGEIVAQDMLATANGRDQEVLVAPLSDDDGGADAPCEVLVLARDVSRERRRARAVAREKDRAEQFFTRAPHGIVVLDHNGRIVRANPGAGEVLAIRPADLTGVPLANLSRDPGDGTIAEHLAQLDERDEARGQWRARSSAGAVVTFAISSSRILTSDGEPGEVLMHLVDVSEQERFQEQLMTLAEHDPLTGLPNRRKFEASLESHLDLARRYGVKGAVLMIDLDHFKEVNDSLGHPAGDQLLVSLAGLLRNRLRSSDCIARLGGDEFAVLLPEADAARARRVAEDILAEIRSEVSTLDGPRRRVTASIGAILLRDSKLTVADVMSTVDMLMYDAKDLGRDRVALLDTEQHELPRTAARLVWVDRIESALAEDRFELYLQPISDLRTGRSDAAEVLVRLREGDELIGPEHFLYIAERSHLIVDLDRLVLRKGLALLEDLQARTPGFRLQLNLSGRSVGDAGYEAELREGLVRHHIEPGGLVLEITETAAVANIESARKFADRLTQLGCRFALDDFGAGFGSFYYLKHLLFDYVKIDGEFVVNCHRSHKDRSILRAIVQMTHSLGKETIAEFVTSEAVLEVLVAEGVDHAQGFHLGRPTDAADYLALRAA